MVLMDSPKNETKENKEDLKGLYDLAIPLSMPVSVIRELIEKFELEALLRPGKMEMTGEVMDREILVLRGDLDTVKEAEKYMFEALDRKVEEWGKKDKEEKYKKFYEEQASLRMKELKDNPEATCNWDLTSV
jgi:superfamily I DNA and RNA helicase